MMKTKATTFGLLLLVSITSGTVGAYTARQLTLGDFTPLKLRAWNFQDLSGVQDLLVSKTVAGENAANAVTFYQLAPPDNTIPNNTFGSVVRQEGIASAVAGLFYAENEGQGGTFGINSIAASYNGKPAIGMEVNGVNRSGDPKAAVRGIDIVNGGNAATSWALGIETSNASPAGKPRFGILLAGEGHGFKHAPASEVGIAVDRIDSGQAIQIHAGDFIALDGRAAQIRMRYNPDAQQIEFYNGSELRFAIPM